MPEAGELKKGDIILLDGQPNKVLDVQHTKKARQGARVAAKLKNLQSGATTSKNFNSSEDLEEAEIERKEFIFVYCNRGKCVFHLKGDKSDRHETEEDKLGEKAKFLKQDIEVGADFFEGELINIELPVKAEYEVEEAPPAVRGNSAGSVTKKVTLETGAVVETPIFVETGDIIRINTEKGTYTERVEKSK